MDLGWPEKPLIKQSSFKNPKIAILRSDPSPWNLPFFPPVFATSDNGRSSFAQFQFKTKILFFLHKCQTKPPILPKEAIVSHVSQYSEKIMAFFMEKAREFLPLYMKVVWWQVHS